MKHYLPACKFVTTHGVRGELKALPLCDGAAFLRHFQRLYPGPQGGEPIPLAGVRAQGNMLLVRLGGVTTMDEARAWVGRTCYFAKAEAALPTGRYFIDDLLGCAVCDAATGVRYGTVTAVERPAAQDIYTVTDASGGQHMFPAVPEFLHGVDIEARVITVTPIPGLFDAPLDGDKE